MAGVTGGQRLLAASENCFFNDSGRDGVNPLGGGVWCVTWFGNEGRVCLGPSDAVQPSHVRPRSPCQHGQEVRDPSSFN